MRTWRPRRVHGDGWVVFGQATFVPGIYVWHALGRLRSIFIASTRYDISSNPALRLNVTPASHCNALKHFKIGIEAACLGGQATVTSPLTNVLLLVLASPKALLGSRVAERTYDPAGRINEVR